MTLPDTDVGGLLLEEEKDLPSTTPISSTWPAPPQPAEDKRPENMRRASEAIGRKIADIVAGRASGEHPALDKLLGPEAHQPYWPDDVCTPACPRRRRPNAEQTGPTITDVSTPIGERVAKVEGQIEHMREDDRDVRNQLSHTASKEMMTSTNRRIDSVHVRIDRDVLPVIKTLQKRRLLRDRIYPVWLTVSLIANIVTVYIIFKREG